MTLTAADIRDEALTILAQVGRRSGDSLIAVGGEMHSGVTIQLSPAKASLLSTLRSAPIIDARNEDDQAQHALDISHDDKTVFRMEWRNGMASVVTFVGGEWELELHNPLD